MKLFLLYLIAGCVMAIPAASEGNGDGDEAIPTPDDMEEEENGEVKSSQHQMTWKRKRMVKSFLIFSWKKCVI